ncbi:MAG: DUF3488 domain-containing transglutaminase family protein [Pseudomonadales bacterium]|nr:DUF3488 domain-containing transglutaminase family protein [Pseudomonadales bacterium]
MTALYQIPRNSLAWLLAAQVAVIAPHVTRLPIWVTLVSAGCFFWRIMVYRGRWRYPGRWTKVAFVLVGVVGIPVGYRTILGLEPAVAMLVIAYVLKLLEMQHKRDAYIVVLLGYFVAMTQFLFFQTIPWTLYMMGAVLMITAGLIGLNQTRTHARPLVTLRTAGLLMAQSVPLMVILFVLFPRLPPIWTVPMPSQVARSGVSDTVAPGDIASLVASSDLAFKATFDGEPPPFSRRYWRGVVLSRFDGRAWRQDNLVWPTVWCKLNEPPDWVSDIETSGDAISYDIILEPTQQNWLYSLNVPTLPNDRDIVMARDYRLASTEPVSSKIRYQVVSHPVHTLEANLSDFWRYRTTLLPDEGNPRSRELARQLMQEAGSPRDYVRRVLRMYNELGFVYTLKPATLGKDPVDGFLFDTRRGFCEHYASSFAFLMRAAGVPARVVAGYQGGEYNQFGDYVAVHQYDAHAWAEVWFEGQGWVRVDPTAAVAPDRIERGLEAAVKDEQTFLADSPLSAMSHQMLWLVELRLQLSAISYYWDSWIVGYNPSVQQAFLSRHLGNFDRKEIGMLMLGLFFAVLGVIGLILLMKRPYRTIAPADKAYLRFCAVLSRQGIPRERGEGPIDYAQRVALARPELEGAVSDVTAAYIDLVYGQSAEGTGRLQRAVRHFRLQALA